MENKEKREEYLDTMVTWAKLRNSNKSNKKVSLDAIGEKEIKAKKLDYHEEVTINSLPYVPHIDGSRHVEILSMDLYHLWI